MRNTNLKDLQQKFTTMYSKIAKANHYIILLGVFLIFNFIITRADLSISFYLIPVAIGFFLNMIFSSKETYLIEINNNGILQTYSDVKYRINKKKNQLIIFERDGNKAIISQGNYTIKPFLIKEETNT